MRDDRLHKEFIDAFERVSRTAKEFPPDVLLQFYALYKRAMKDENFVSSQGEHELISAFKSNALFQVQHLTIDQAKEAYIEIAEKYLEGC